MRTLAKQQGMGAIGWLVVMMIFVSVLTLAYKIVPAFYDNGLVQDALKSIGQSPDAQQLSRDQIKQKLLSYFDLNGVRGAPTKSIDVVRRADTMLVNINYEVRDSVFANIDIVIKFENQLDVSNPDACCVPLIKNEKK